MGSSVVVGASVVVGLSVVIGLSVGVGSSTVEVTREWREEGSEKRAEKGGGEWRGGGGER